MALANPVVKRYLTTQIEVFTVWTTVTADSAAPTAPADGYDYYGSSSMSPEAPMSSEAPTASEVPMSSEAPMSSEVPTSSEAPKFYASSASSQAPASSSSSVSNPGSDSLPSYAKDILYQHNIHRANHSDTGAMTWSDALAATALKHAKNCIFEHNTYVISLLTLTHANSSTVSSTRINILRDTGKTSKLVLLLRGCLPRSPMACITRNLKTTKTSGVKTRSRGKVVLACGAI